MWWLKNNIIVAFVMALVGAFFYGRKSKDKDNAIDYAKKRKAVDEALENVSDDPYLARVRLQERGKR